jgi:hypothetical protein
MDKELRRNRLFANLYRKTVFLDLIAVDKQISTILLQTGTAAIGLLKGLVVMEGGFQCLESLDRRRDFERLKLNVIVRVMIIRSEPGRLRFTG